MIPEQYFGEEKFETPVIYTVTVSDNLGTYSLEEWQRKGPEHEARCRQAAYLTRLASSSTALWSITWERG